MRYHATIKIAGDSDLIYNAFEPDLGHAKTERSEFKIKKTEKEVSIEIIASDAVAFRATINGITRMLSVIEKTKGI